MKHQGKRHPTSVSGTKDTITFDTGAEKLALSRQKHRSPGLYGLMALICLSLYAWTIDFPFVFDDYYYLKDNPLFNSGVSLPVIGGMKNLVHKARNLHVDPDLAYNIILRPVAYASFYFNHALDDFDPRWYRIFNVAIHLANSVMVVVLLKMLTRELVHRNEMEEETSRFVSTSAGLLFLVHPAAIESVTYVIQRFTSMGMAWFLGALLAYIVFSRSTTRRARWSWLFLSCGLFLAGLLTKEDCFTLPWMVIIMERLIYRLPWKSVVVRAAPLFVLSLVVPALVVRLAAIRAGQDVTLVEAIQLVDRQPESWGIWTYFVSQIPVVAGYIGTLVWPTGLNLSPKTTAYSSMWQWDVMLSFLMMTSFVLGLLIGVLRHPADGRQRLMLFGALWFFVTISISSSIVPLPDLAAQHRTYLPSLGFFAVVGISLDCIRGWLSRRLKIIEKANVGLLAPVVIALSFVTCRQNYLWHSNISLWSHCAKQWSGSIAAWNNLGAAYFEAGDLNRALDCFEKVVAIEPKYQGAQLNISHVLLRQERWQECHDRTVKMMVDDPGLERTCVAIYNVAMSLIGLGHTDQGVKILQALAADGAGFVPAKDMIARLSHAANGKAIADKSPGVSLSTYPPGSSHSGDASSAE